MRRRQLLALAAGAVAAPPAARAQRKAVPVIGYLNPTEPIAGLLAEFQRGLADQGYVDGGSVAIEYRWAEGRYDRLAGLAAELVQDRVDVIVATGGVSSGRAAKAATGTIPIVVLSGGDPVAAGLTDSISRPSGNVTGVAQLVTASASKRLQLLHELVPGAGRIGYLENPALWNAPTNARAAQDAAGELGIKLLPAKATNESELDSAFAAFAAAPVGALLVEADPFFFMQRNRLVTLAARHRIPAMYFFREFVTAGGLVSYSTSLSDGYRLVGVYTGKILRGAKPGDLPIAQQSEKVELAINLKTARELGLAVPQLLLAQADEVIE